MYYHFAHDNDINSIMGNPIICATGIEQDCNGTTAMPISLPLITQSKHVPLFVEKCLYNSIFNGFGYLTLYLSQPFLLNSESQPSIKPKTNKMALAFGTSLGCFCFLFFGFGFVFWWRRRHNLQVFFDING